MTPEEHQYTGVSRGLNFSEFGRRVKQVSIAGVLALASGWVHAEAPVALIGGEVNNNIDVRGTIINAGAGLGGMTDGDVDLEVSIGTVHGNSEINGDLNNNITVYGALGAATIVNAALAWQGTTCAKTSIGSIGASTCTYDGQ